MKNNMTRPTFKKIYYSVTLVLILFVVIYFEEKYSIPFPYILLVVIAFLIPGRIAALLGSFLPLWTNCGNYGCAEVNFWTSPTFVILD